MILTFLDTETTGLVLKDNEIIQLAMIRYVLSNEQNAKLYQLDKFEVKFIPSHIETASPKALEMNHYSKEEWEKTAKSFESVSHIIKDMIEESDILVGQNLIFDLEFIDKLFKSNNLNINFPYFFDTKEMAKDSGESNTKLDFLCEKYNIQFKGEAHCASSDCERTKKLFEILSDKIDPVLFSF
ncbi:3'-5' exonuclease [Candidatus Pacearchaeota archaeon]|jgi:DNA polymerase III epsilon subunit-like protein|nr:3'-5' exonuclease [Candidatus Pacearchaeota archaeon]